MIIKVRYTKDGEPHGRAYTYIAPDWIEIGSTVELPSGGTGIVTEVITDKKPEDYPYPIKNIVKVAPEEEKKESEGKAND